MALKPALSIADHITLLQNRGMVFADSKLAAAFLAKNNYFRLNIYFHKLMDAPDHFPAGVTFERVIEIYGQDQWLRNRLLSILEPIEIVTKANLVNYLGTTYGSDCFYHYGFCLDRAEHQAVFDIFQTEISRRCKDPVVIHHHNKYGGVFPIWVVVDYLSMNALSRYYANLKGNDKKQIASAAFYVNEVHLENWLHVLCVLRNICAHYGYLYRRDFALKPKITKRMNWPQQNGSLFALCLVMRELSDKARWQEFLTAVDQKLAATPSFSLADYGFPADWRQRLARP